MRDERDVLIAVVVFRWLNRISSGEAIFKHTTAFEEFLRTRNASVLKAALLDCIGANGPFVTGAYRVYTPPGISKLDGVINYIQKFVLNFSWRTWPSTGKLESAWWYLRQFDGLGDLTSYEIVSDLRWTALLDQAPDIMTWANAGPGAVAGLNRLHGRPVKQNLSKYQSLQEMRELLKLSQSEENWRGKPFEMPEVEHVCCETNKMLRVKLGEGQLKEKFHLTRP
jgi:hypothetical protein